VNLKKSGLADGPDRRRQGRCRLAKLEEARTAAAAEGGDPEEAELPAAPTRSAPPSIRVRPDL
jgi:hypothetical protein